MRRHLTVTNPSWGKAARPLWHSGVPITWPCPHPVSVSPSRGHVSITLCSPSMPMSPSRACVPLVCPHHVSLSCLSSHPMSMSPLHVCNPITYPSPHCTPCPHHTALSSSPAYVPMFPSCPHPYHTLYPCCMSVPVAHTSPPHDHVPSHSHVLAACPCPHPMPECPPHARGSIARSRPCCTPMSLLHTCVPTTCPRCMPVSLLHIHVPITCPCPHDTPVSLLRTHVPTTLPCPHGTSESPWHSPVSIIPTSP